MHRAGSTRWQQNKPKYEEWSDEDDEDEDDILYEEDEEPEEQQPEEQVLKNDEVVPEKLEAKVLPPKDVLVTKDADDLLVNRAADFELKNRVGSDSSHNFKTSIPDTSVASKAVPETVFANKVGLASTGPSLGGVKSTSGSTTLPATGGPKLSSDVAVVTESHALPTITTGESSQDVSKDSIESFQKKSDADHETRQQNLNLMEGLYNSITKQLSNQDEDSDAANSIHSDGSQDWGDSDKDQLNVVPVGSNFSKESMVSSGSRSVLQGELHSKLDKDFEDLFQDFDNLTFSNEDKKIEKFEAFQPLENTAHLSPHIEPIAPLSPKSEHNQSDDLSDILAEDEQGFRASQGIWQQSGSDLDVSQPLPTPQAPASDSEDEYPRVAPAAVPDLHISSFPEKSVLGLAEVSKEKFEKKVELPPKEELSTNKELFASKQFPANKELPSSNEFSANKELPVAKAAIPNITFPEDSSNADFKKAYSSEALPEATENAPENVLASLDTSLVPSESSDDSGRFRASEGLWSSKDIIEPPAKGAVIKNVEPMDFGSPSASSIADSEDFNSGPVEEQRVFGDNFPSARSDTSDGELVDFRTSMYRNDFVNRTRQQQDFDPASISKSALDAFKIEDHANISAAKDILGDSSISSLEDSQKPRDKFLTDYLGVEDQEDEESESQGFKAGGGIWAPLGKDTLEAGTDIHPVPSASTLEPDHLDAQITPTEAEPQSTQETNIQPSSSIMEKKYNEFKPNEFSERPGFKQQFSGSAASSTPTGLSTVSGDIVSQSDMSMDFIERQQRKELGSTLGQSQFSESIPEIDEEAKPLVLDTNTLHDSSTVKNKSPPGTPVTSPSSHNAFQTPVSKQLSTTLSEDDSPAVPPKDPEIFNLKSHAPMHHNMQQILSNTPENTHNVLRNIRREEYLHDSGLHTWLDDMLKQDRVPTIEVASIGPNTKAAYEIAAARAQGQMQAANQAGNRRISFNSKLNISSHRFLKGTKNVNKNVKGKLEEGFAKGLFKRKK